MTAEIMQFGLSMRMQSFQENHLADESVWQAVDAADGASIVHPKWTWHGNLAVKAVANDRGMTRHEVVCSFELEEGRIENGCVAVTLDFQSWHRDNYVFMPCVAYNGNRYRSIRKKYPPMLHEEDGIGPDMPTTLSDVARLNIDEVESRIEKRSGDMATPCFGCRDVRGGGMLLLAPDLCMGEYTGFDLWENADKTSAAFTLSAPAVRRSVSSDRGVVIQKGDRIELRFHVYTFDCPDVNTLFRKFWLIRKDISGEAPLLNRIPWSYAFWLIEDKYNRTQFSDQYQYYCLSPDQNFWHNDWQSGWCGGGLNALPLLAEGCELSQERSRRTIDSVFGHLQHHNGFVIPVMYQGVPMGDDYDFQYEHPEILLLRKNGDQLYFAMRQIQLVKDRGEEAPEAWLSGVRRLADAFVRLWRKYGQFGQFVDMEAETILQGGTCSAAIASGGLALAGQFFGCADYLSVAEASAEWYVRECADRGYMNGGPGEILQDADSESAFGLLESLVTLYEVTKDAKWLARAADCAKQCSSWVVSYDFKFPKESSFGKHDMRTTGSVYANIQNRHSAPGICTLSSMALVKLWYYTGEEGYLTLAKEIGHNITQYVSLPGNELRNWDGGIQPVGWMNERVNMSDWEGKNNIGEIFRGSCWCEISCMLTYSDMPGVLLLKKSGRTICLDHVQADTADKGDHWAVRLHNPTDFPAEYRVQSIADHANGKAWMECVDGDCQSILVPAHETRACRISKA